MICGMSAHAGRTRRPRGVPGEPIKGLIRGDLKAHALKVAEERGISLSLYLEQVIAADMNAPDDTKKAEPPDQLALTA